MIESYLIANDIFLQTTKIYKWVIIDWYVIYLSYKWNWFSVQWVSTEVHGRIDVRGSSQCGTFYLLLFAKIPSQTY